MSVQLSAAAGRFEGLVEVGDEVLGVLEADAEPDEVVRDAERHALRLLHRGVRHQVGQLRQTLIPAQGLRKGDQLNQKQECNKTLGAIPILYKHFYRLVQHRMFSILLCASL